MQPYLMNRLVGISKVLRLSAYTTHKAEPIPGQSHILDDLNQSLLDSFPDYERLRMLNMWGYSVCPIKPRP
jgi:hypothetical protein